LGSILAVDNIASSNYNAFQFNLRNNAAPFIFGLSYTYSHSIDNSSDRSDADFVNSYELAGNKASSNFDQRHNLSLNYIYDLRLRQILHSWTHLLDDDPTNLLSPRKTGSGGGAWDSPVSRALLDDWQFSGIIIFQTGTPFSVINGGSAGGTGVPDNAGVANY